MRDQLERRAKESTDARAASGVKAPLPPLGAFRGRRSFPAHSLSLPTSPSLFLLLFFFFPSSFLPSSDFPVIIFFLAQPTSSLPILPFTPRLPPFSTYFPLRPQPNRQVSPGRLSVVFHCFPLVMPISHFSNRARSPIPIPDVRHRHRVRLDVVCWEARGDKRRPTTTFTGGTLRDELLGRRRSPPPRLDYVGIAFPRDTVHG